MDSQRKQNKHALGWMSQIQDWTLIKTHDDAWHESWASLTAELCFVCQWLICRCTSASSQNKIFHRAIRKRTKSETSLDTLKEKTLEVFFLSLGGDMIAIWLHHLAFLFAYLKSQYVTDRTRDANKYITENNDLCFNQYVFNLST